jgi:hypothetical protein
VANSTEPQDFVVSLQPGSAVTIDPISDMAAMIVRMIVFRFKRSSK